MKSRTEANSNWKRHALGAFATGVVSLSMVACSSSGYHERRGAAAGAATGAIIGGIIGHQSGEDGEGAAIGAAAGALIGREAGRAKDNSDYRTAQQREVDQAVDYGELMTEAEKERVRDRAGKDIITNWSAYLTPDEKRRLMDRAGATVGG